MGKVSSDAGEAAAMYARECANLRARVAELEQQLAAYQYYFGTLLPQAIKRAHAALQENSGE